METLTAIVVLAGQYGTSALVKAISGDSTSGSLAGELVKAISDSESRIDERLSAIETKIDALREQPFAIAFGRGTRHLFHAIRANDRARITDLEDAYRALVEAIAASPSPLHEAVAQRYLLLCLIALRREGLLVENVARLETLTLVEGFKAAAVASSTNRIPILSRRRAEAEAAAQQARKSAMERMEVCARLLDEADLFAKHLGLPPRSHALPYMNLSRHLGAYLLFKDAPVRVGPLVMDVKDLDGSQKAFDVRLDHPLPVPLVLRTLWCAKDGEAPPSVKKEMALEVGQLHAEWTAPLGTVAQGVGWNCLTVGLSGSPHGLLGLEFYLRD